MVGFTPLWYPAILLTRSLDNDTPAREMHPQLILQLHSNSISLDSHKLAVLRMRA